MSQSDCNNLEKVNNISFAWFALPLLSSSGWSIPHFPKLQGQALALALTTPSPSESLSPKSPLTPLPLSFGSFYFLRSLRTNTSLLTPSPVIAPSPVSFQFHHLLFPSQKGTLQGSLRTCQLTSPSELKTNPATLASGPRGIGHKILLNYITFKMFGATRFQKDKRPSQSHNRAEPRYPVPRIPMKCWTRTPACGRLGRSHTTVTAYGTNTRITVSSIHLIQTTHRKGTQSTYLPNPAAPNSSLLCNYTLKKNPFLVSACHWSRNRIIVPSEGSSPF